MKFRQRILLVALTIGFVTLSHSQRRNYDIKNGFAIGGGITQFDINTDNFKTEQGSGWMIHASATGDLPHRWYNLSYGMQLSESTFGVLASDGTSAAEFLDYKVFTAQLALLFHIKAIPNLLTIDVGPMAQFNGKMALEDDSKENYIIEGYTNLLAEDIEDITPFNLNGAIGATLGFRFIKLRAQYIYGFLNSFEKLNSQDLDLGNNPEKLKGNMNMLAFTALITF